MRTFAAAAVLALLQMAALAAHDAERTRITLSFAEDGTFVLDIANDPNWLLLRLESFAGGLVPAAVTPARRDERLRELAGVFIDRVVLWVDGREIRPTSADYDPLRETFRLRGQMPADARTLRWLYGPVIDPYPLTIKRADGRSTTEWIEGSNWSGVIDLSGQFRRAYGFDPIVLVVGLFVIGVLLRLADLRFKTRHLDSDGVARSASTTRDAKSASAGEQIAPTRGRYCAAAGNDDRTVHSSLEAVVVCDDARRAI